MRVGFSSCWPTDVCTNEVVALIDINCFCHYIFCIKQVLVEAHEQFAAMAESDWIRGLIDMNDSTSYNSRMTRPRHLDTNFSRERQRATPTAKSRRESATLTAFEERETPRSRRRSNNNSSTADQQQQQHLTNRDNR
jgi:hypothetical protein